MPLITSNYPAYQAVVERTSCGLCVDPDAPEEIADAIEWLMEHPAEAAEMGRRGREAVIREFNWEIEAAKLLRFYEELIGLERGVAAARQAEG